MSFSFDSAQLDQAASLWDEVTLDPTQVALVRDLGSSVGRELGIDPIPCRGMWLQAVRDWQHAHGRHASAISTLTPEGRLRAALEIKDYFLTRALGMLTDGRDSQRLKGAVDTAYDLYMAKYNRRQ